MHVLVQASPDPIPKRRKGSDSGSASSAIMCMGLYWSTYNHVMVCKTKKRSAMSPDPIRACVMGSENDTIIIIMSHFSCIYMPWH